jgi:hypothetical protein
MKNRRPLPSLVLLVPFLWACGKQEELDAEKRASAASAAQAAVEAAAQAESAITFQGVVRLQGALAERSDGFVFVSVKPSGTPMPSYSRKYSYADAEMSPSAGGERKLTFELNSDHLMGGMGPGEHVLEAWFDLDGFVDTKDGSVRNTVPVGHGGSGLEVVLAPTGQ